MHNQSRTSSGHRSRGTVVSLRVALAITALFAACRSGGQVSPGVTQRGVSTLRLGMTRDETIAALGAPLISGQPAGTDSKREILTYAEPRVWHVGRHRLLSGGGVAFVVTLDGGSLTAAHIADTSIGESKFCACTLENCLPKWAETCLSLFPAESTSTER